MEYPSQAKLCAAIRYYQRGDFSAFKKICEISGIQSKSNNKFFEANQFLAAQIAGLIEVSVVESSTRWWAAFDGNYEINSLASKAVGVTLDWYDANHEPLIDLIIDEDGQSLIVGTSSLAPSSNSKIFGIFVSKMFPSLQRIEEETMAEENNFFSKENQFEVFNPNDMSWQSHREDSANAKGLVRMRKRFGGMEYFIIHQELNLAFRILNSDWMFILSLNILNWNFSEIIVIKENILTIPRQFKLPNLLYRFLFANSMSCCIGAQVKFFGLHSAAIEVFQQYILNGRKSNGF
jgi:hypothetical protein